jgi:hypothetical protein
VTFGQAVKSSDDFHALRCTIFDASNQQEGGSTMTNHTPTFTSSSESGSFTETAGTTGSTTDHLLSGTLNFTDSDHTDTHTTTAALKSVVWSGGSTIPTATLTDLTNAMSSVVQSDQHGSGAIQWSFAAEDDDFDFSRQE